MSTVSLAGLTATDCPKACSAESCVISGSFYCAHPRKGKLQGGRDVDAIERLNKAEKMLAKSVAEGRFS